MVIGSDAAAGLSMAAKADSASAKIGPMRWILAVALLALLAVGAAVWSSRAGGAAAERARGEPTGRAAAPEPAPTSPAGAPAAVERTVVVLEPPPPPPEPLGAEDGGAVPLPGPDFSAKYAGRDGEALELALDELEAAVHLESSQRFEARFEQGRFEEHPLGGEDVDGVRDAVAAGVPPGELCQMRVVMEPESVGEGALRPLALQAATLPRAEFPELYALVDERDWLRRYLAPSDGR
jgi:hypothetical protein